MRDMEFVKEVVSYFNQHKSTVRKVAKKFGISKSTVYVYLTEVLPNETSSEILAFNKSQRSIRGGHATRKKYALLKRL